MKVYDVIVVGGGVVGVAIGRELSRYRLRVAICEKETELAFGVSKSNSGIIHPGTQNPVGSLKGRLCVQGNRLIRRIAGELGVDFREVGELIVAFNEDERRRLETILREGRRLGVPRLAIVGPAWLAKHEPNLNPAAVAALYAPSAGIISPYRLTYDLAENAQRNGVEIHTEAAVRRIGLRPARSGRDARFEVETAAGVFMARYLVNAAGLFADDVARMTGITDVTIRARKGEEFILDKKRQYLTNHLLFPLPSKDSKGILVIKTSDGNPMIGPTAEAVDDKDDRSTTDAGFAKVVGAVRRLVPSIDENDVIAYFAGLRPVAGDDFIIRAEAAVPGCVTVAGIQSPGLTSSPAIALLVLDLLRKAGLGLTKKLLFHRRRAKTTHLFAIPLERTRRLIRKDPAYGDIVCRCEMVSAKEIRDAVARGATTLDGVKFRTRAQAGRCHGSFCTTRIMKILAEERGRPLTAATKRGPGSKVVKGGRRHDHA